MKVSDIYKKVGMLVYDKYDSFRYMKLFSLGMICKVSKDCIIDNVSFTKNEWIVVVQKVYPHLIIVRERDVHNPFPINARFIADAFHENLLKDRLNSDIIVNEKVKSSRYTYGHI